jgi:hypothetical protein
MVRDQVIRHNLNSAVYNKAYINKKVLFNVLFAILKRPSADSILRMLIHMSLMHDPRALINTLNDVFAALSFNLAIVELKQRREELKARAYKIQGTEVEVEVQRLIAEISNA